MNSRLNHLFLLVLVSAAARVPFAPAQTPANPTPDQLMQLLRAQPGVDISAPITATAAFDPPKIRPGEKAVYRVTFNATAVSVKWPGKIPAPPELNMHLNASGQTVQALGGEYQNMAMFDYAVRPLATGQFAIPDFQVQVYGKTVVVPSAQLEVKNQLPEPHQAVRQLIVEPAATNVFVGEVIIVRVVLPPTAAGVVDGVSDPQLNGGNFVVDKNTVRQSVRSVVVNNRRLTAYVYETSLTPIAAGRLELAAQGFTIERRTDGQAKLVLLDSEPAVINVRPLPVDGELAGFNGAVGHYSCDRPGIATNTLKVGEPVALTVVIRGPESLSRINPPRPPRAAGWQVFPAVRGNIVGGSDGPGASFQYTLIPLTTAVRATPEIPFSCFDPGTGHYVDLTIPALPVTVLAGELSTNAEAPPMISEAAIEPQPKIGLSKLALSPGWSAGGLVPLQLRGWFLLVQILPALGFCGLWFWDRRRQYLEQHPEVVRRRAARRALRRERRLLERAAAGGDVGQFVHRAVSALQIASAPHYPAAPRALVCGDVLKILTAREREGKSGETVRHFFAAADAAAFANNPGIQRALLAEKSALTEAISRLEARL